jgi:hypothetical protein
VLSSLLYIRQPPHYRGWQCGNRGAATLISLAVSGRNDRVGSASRSSAGEGHPVRRMRYRSVLTVRGEGQPDAELSEVPHEGVPDDDHLAHVLQEPTITSGIKM